MIKKDTNPAHISREEEAIQRVITYIKGTINPFTHSMDDLIHIVSGMEVPDSIAADIETAHEKGQAAFSNFCQTRLLSDVEKLHDPIPKLKIKSFEDVGKTVLVHQKSKSKEHVIKAECILMARLIITGTARGISIDNLMQYSLGPVPMSLAYIDGSLMKTDKAKHSLP